MFLAQRLSFEKPSCVVYRTGSGIESCYHPCPNLEIMEMNKVDAIFFRSGHVESWVVPLLELHSLQFWEYKLEVTKVFEKVLMPVDCAFDRLVIHCSFSSPTCYPPGSR